MFQIIYIFFVVHSSFVSGHSNLHILLSITDLSVTIVFRSRDGAAVARELQAPKSILVDLRVAERLARLLFIRVVTGSIPSRIH